VGASKKGRLKDEKTAICRIRDESDLQPKNEEELSEASYYSRSGRGIRMPDQTTS